MSGAFDLRDVRPRRSVGFGLQALDLAQRDDAHPSRQADVSGLRGSLERLLLLASHHHAKSNRSVLLSRSGRAADLFRFGGFRRTGLCLRGFAGSPRMLRTLCHQQ